MHFPFKMQACHRLELILLESEVAVSTLSLLPLKWPPSFIRGSFAADSYTFSP